MPKEEENIDYLHPHGKPAPTEQPKKDEKVEFDGRELEAESKRLRNAEIDTDGHHVCSRECQNKHKTRS